MKNKKYTIIALIILLILNLTVFSYAENRNKLEITMEYQFNEASNTVTAIMHSNNQLAHTKPTWNLSGDKLSYSKVFDANTTYSTMVQDIYGNISNVEIKINQILKPQISFEYVYNSNGIITGKIISNIELKDTKPTWKLSSDRKTYSKVFDNEQDYYTSVQTVSGETINVRIEIKKPSMNITINYDYNEEKDLVTVSIKSNNEIKDTKPTWTLSSDKKIYSKVFDTNQIYTTPVQDIYGNIKNANIEITKMIPKITIEYKYNSNNTSVTVKMKSNLELANTKPTWSLSEDKKTYSKVFDANQIYSTPVQEKYGNVVTANIEITKLIPKITMEYQHNDNNTVTAIMHSNCKLANTKPTWTLSEDQMTYTKIFDSDQSYTTNVQDIYGNVAVVQIDIRMKTINIDTSRYPGYKEAIENMMASHPNWKFELLYTGLNFNNAVYGEYSRHSANLVPTSSGSEWICPVCGTKTYDTGWYGASDKAIAYYLDPRNFLNDSNVFQFLDANKYEPTSVSLSGIQSNVNGTFLQNYANDIDNACKNKGVNPYYVISRLIQENGKNGSTTSRGMDGGDGKTYYNPFNIGASGNSTSEVIANALSKAKSSGWDSMQKALEGGIVFLKTNWLDNYQNTLYQNRFDIDSRNGTALYAHQYMQNLSAAYSEGNLLRGYYINAGKVDSNLTFIIPVYEGMSANLSPRPSDGMNNEEYPMNVIVNTESSSLALRSEASTSSTVIARYDKGTVLLSVRRGINSTWQHVVTKDGKVGYMSGEYLRQVNDEIKCNYSAYVKTERSGGLNVRTGPSTTAGFSKVDFLPDYTPITVIDDSTYKGYEGSDWVQWSRIILSDGRQAFVPSSYVKR